MLSSLCVAAELSGAQRGLMLHLVVGNAVGVLVAVAILRRQLRASFKAGCVRTYVMVLVAALVSLVAAWNLAALVRDRVFGASAACDRDATVIGIGFAVWLVMYAGALYAGCVALRTMFDRRGRAWLVLLGCTTGVAAAVYCVTTDVSFLRDLHRAARPSAEVSGYVVYYIDYDGTVKRYSFASGLSDLVEGARGTGGEWYDGDVGVSDIDGAYIAFRAMGAVPSVEVPRRDGATVRRRASEFPHIADWREETDTKWRRDVWPGSPAGIVVGRAGATDRRAYGMDAVFVCGPVYVGTNWSASNITVLHNGDIVFQLGTRERACVFWLDPRGRQCVLLGRGQAPVVVR